MTKLESGVKRRRKEKEKKKSGGSNGGEEERCRREPKKSANLASEMAMSCQAIRTSYETLDRAR